VSPDATARALILDYDELLGVPVDVVTRYSAEGWMLFAHAWRPQVARGELVLSDVQAAFTELRCALGVEIDIACCPHDAGPPICWCRKPLPGSVLEFARRRNVDLTRSLVVGASVADRTMAERLGAQYQAAL
jgi:hypothetical protein